MRRIILWLAIAGGVAVAADLLASIGLHNLCVKTPTNCAAGYRYKY
jgi:hypothetical protein